MVSIGVVGDSHIPDRIKAIPDRVKQALEGVDQILHTGDISTRRVITQLNQIAPTTAVCGNSDLFLWGLPREVFLQFHSVNMVLVHGHGGVLRYIYEKILYYSRGFYYEDLYANLLKSYPRAQVIVFGHSHKPLCKCVNGKLLFNPGALASTYRPPVNGPTLGRMTIDPHHLVGEIIDLQSGKTILEAQFPLPL